MPATNEKCMISRSTNQNLYFPGLLMHFVIVIVTISITLIHVINSFTQSCSFSKYIEVVNVRCDARNSYVSIVYDCQWLSSVNARNLKNFGKKNNDLDKFYISQNWKTVFLSQSNQIKIISCCLFQSRISKNSLQQFRLVYHEWY